MKANLKNHLEALDTAILVDRKRGECYQLSYHFKDYFFASLTQSTSNQPVKESYITLRKIQSGLACRRYRILEVKN